MEIEESFINVFWTNTEKGCKFIFVDSYKNESYLLYRKRKWNISLDIYNTPEKEVKSLTKEEANELWDILLKQYDFMWIEDES